MSRARWWRPLVPPLLAVAVLVTGSAATAMAAYPASVDVNTSAFNPPCDGDVNNIVPKMQAAAKAAYNRLGHVASAFTGAAFTRAATLKRTPADWGYYVHSHGDYYWHAADGRRYTGFREDSGDCSQAIVYSKDMVKAGEIKGYEDLADPKWKGKVCMRSSSNMYNLSLMSSMIDSLGEPKAEAWAKGVVANFARDPKGGDTDQIKAIAAGECALSVVNTYYYVRMLKSAKADERAAIERVGLAWPNQDNRGTHVNISGAGVLKSAKNRDAAVKFLEYLASDDAQRYFANGNNEFTVVQSVNVDNRELASLGKFKADAVNVSVFGRNQPAAQKVYDRAGWR